MRKISVVGADEPVKDIMSRRSVIGTMDKFVQAVDNMNEIVMVPSLLMDVSMDQINPSSDMHSFYSMLNTVRQQLLFGSGNGQNANKEPTFVEVGKRPALRRMSSVSSTLSSELSDSESDVGGFDSGDEVNCSRITSDFQYHLMGLCKSLKQLTQSANTLTTKYRAEVEGGQLSR